MGNDAPSSQLLLDEVRAANKELGEWLDLCDQMDADGQWDEWCRTRDGLERRRGEALDDLAKVDGFAAVKEKAAQATERRLRRDGHLATNELKQAMRAAGNWAMNLDAEPARRPAVQPDPADERREMACRVNERLLLDKVADEEMSGEEATYYEYCPGGPLQWCWQKQREEAFFDILYVATMKEARGRGDYRPLGMMLLEELQDELTRKNEGAGYRQGHADSVAGRPNRCESANPHFRAGYKYGYAFDQHARSRRK